MMAIMATVSVLSCRRSNNKRVHLLLFAHFVWFHAVLLCTTTTLAFQEQQQPPGSERILWTPTSSSSATKGKTTAALVKPPFPNGPNGGKVIRIPGLFDNHALLTPRDVSVWLPPQYNNNLDKHANKEHRFSVLYCHDGQNVMEDERSWTGMSWRLPGALMRLSQHGLLRDPGSVPPIVVLLPSAESDLIPGVKRRHLEYGSLGISMGNIPVSHAQAHADLVATVVKPYIDATFRTNPTCASTIGSSMGGQASMNLLLRHPDVFSAAACLSPYFSLDTVAAVGLSSLLVGNGKNDKAKSHQWQSKRIYLDMGGDVQDIKVPYFDLLDHFTTKHWWNPGYFWLDTSLQPTCNAMYKCLQMMPGMPSENIKNLQVPGARHNERAWSNRIHQPLLFLYGKQQQQQQQQQQE